MKSNFLTATVALAVTLLFTGCYHNMHDFALDLEVESKDMRATQLTLEADKPGVKVMFDIDTIAAPNPIKYRTFEDEKWSDWKTYSNKDTITLINAGDRVQFKGSNATYAHDLTSHTVSSHFKVWDKCYVYGNIMSLIDSVRYDTCTSLTGSYTFFSLFSGNKSLDILSTKKLVLPAQRLTLFCYGYMFVDCTNLTSAPELPATELDSACYLSMFGSCKSLTSSPVLPAQTLVYNCYLRMFYDCRNLSTVTCFASDITASDCTNNWLQYAGSSITYVKTFNALVGTPWQENSDSGIPTGWQRVDHSTGGTSDFSTGKEGKWVKQN